MFLLIRFVASISTIRNVNPLISSTTLPAAVYCATQHFNSSPVVFSGFYCFTVSCFSSIPSIPRFYCSLIIVLYYYYRPQGKVIFSQASAILSTIGLMATRPLLNLVTAPSVCIPVDCFLVVLYYYCSMILLAASYCSEILSLV